MTGRERDIDTTIGEPAAFIGRVVAEPATVESEQSQFTIAVHVDDSPARFITVNAYGELSESALAVKKGERVVVVTRLREGEIKAEVAEIQLFRLSRPFR